MKLKLGDEVVGLDGRVYVVEVSPSVMFGLEAVACVDCDLNHIYSKMGWRCTWVGKVFGCSHCTGGCLCFKLKE